MKRIKPGWPNLVNNAHFSTPADPRAKHGRDLRGECPLRCPGCYAYEDAHLGTTNLRSLSDFKGRELIARILALMDQYKPLHLSIVGGDPLVRYRELDVLLPQLVKRAHIQVVTSAFSPIPIRVGRAAEPATRSFGRWLATPKHDVRRKPATYERILRNIQGHHIEVHCTIAMVKRSGYIPEFVDFWSANSSAEKIWMSIFTPSEAQPMPNASCPTSGEGWRTPYCVPRHRNKFDMPEGMIKEFLSPPASLDRCIFAQSTHTLSTDLRTRVEPRQFGGNPTARDVAA